MSPSDHGSAGVNPQGLPSATLERDRASGNDGDKTHIANRARRPRLGAPDGRKSLTSPASCRSAASGRALSRGIWPETIDRSRRSARVGGLRAHSGQTRWRYGASALHGEVGRPRHAFPMVPLEGGSIRVLSAANHSLALTGRAPALVAGGHAGASAAPHCPAVVRACTTTCARTASAGLSST